MNLWHDFLHFVFISFKSTSLLQILKLVIHSKHSQWLHLFPLIYIRTLFFLYATTFAWRSSRLQMFFKLGALKISANFTKSTCVKRLFLTKLQASPKKRLQYRCVSVKFAKFLRIPLVTASVRSFSIIYWKSGMLSFGNIWPNIFEI